jgi:hypothetical protein
MATYYVDINNSYVTVGDGSSGNPFNFDQLLSNSELNGADTFLIKGSRDYDTFVTIGKMDLDHSHSFLPWDLALYGPWRINSQYTITIGSYLGTLSGAILYCYGSGSVIVLKMYSGFSNVYVKSSGLYTYIEIQWNANINGCTFIVPSLQITGSATFNDCIVDADDPGSGTIYNKCVFSAASITGTLNNCQTSWTPPLWPVWNAPLSSFNKSVLNYGTISTPPSPGTPPYTDYNLDFSGGARNDIGAYANATTPAVWGKDTTPFEGMAVYDKTIDLIRTYDGSAWQTSTLDGKVKTSVSDPAPGYLVAKLEAGMALAVSEDTTNPLDYLAKLDVQFGTLTNQACVGSDPRLSDSRTPTLHDFAGALHQTSQIAAIQSKVSDGFLITSAAGEIVTLPAKTLPTLTDQMVIEDAADSNSKKSVEIKNLAPWLYGTGAPPSAAGLRDGTLYIKYTP